MTGKSPRILVVGYSAFDVTIPVDGMPLSDTKNEVPGIRVGGGGPGATAAVAMVRLGGVVRLVTPLTDDLPGRIQEDELTAAGVDLSYSPRLLGYESAKAVILVDPNNEHRTIFWSRGDLPQLDPATVDPLWLEDTDLFYLDGHEFPASLKLAPHARDRALPVVMDAGSVRTGSAELVALCTEVISSEIFAPVLTGLTDPVAALVALAAYGPDRVAMTFGGGGMLALLDGKPWAVPAYDLPIVDTTGAGDVFHAGYAYARALGWDFLTCLRLGAASAGLKCRDWGGRLGLAGLAEAKQVMSEAATRPLDPRITAYGSPSQGF